MSQVEINEMLRLCKIVSHPVRPRLEGQDIPCVTKLPKFLPTMQCQVAPFLSSNYHIDVSVVVIRLLAWHVLPSV